MAPRATVRPMIVFFLNSTLSQTPNEHRKKPVCIVWYLLPERGQFVRELPEVCLDKDSQLHTLPSTSLQHFKGASECSILSTT